MSPLLLFLSVIPCLVICYIIYKVDRYEKEEYWALALSFLGGALVTIPAMELQKLAESLVIPKSAEIFLTAFIWIAANEELWKLFALLVCAFPYRFFNEPLDGIVYAVMVAMGFACVENIVYAHRFGIETAILRAFTAAPAHTLFAILMGYYAGTAKFEFGWMRARRLLIAVLFATLFHGIYDLLILQEWTEWLLVLAPIGIYLGLFFTARLVRFHAEHSPFKTNA